MVNSAVSSHAQVDGSSTSLVPSAVVVSQAQNGSAFQVGGSSSSAAPVVAVLDQAQDLVVAGHADGVGMEVVVPEEPAAILQRQRFTIPGATTSREDFATLWDQCREEYSQLDAATHAAAAESVDSVIGEFDGLWRQCSSKFPDWPDDLTRLAVGALLIYKTKPSDISPLFMVSMLWTIGGNVFLRAHKSTLYYYNRMPGCWEVFDSVIPPEAWKAIDRYCKRLEGLLRDMAWPVDQTPDALLVAINRCFTKSAGLSECYDVWLQNVYMNRGAKVLKGGNVGQPANAVAGDGRLDGRDPVRAQVDPDLAGDDQLFDDAMPGVEEAPILDRDNAQDKHSWWVAFAASTTQRLSVRLIGELTGGKALKLFAMFCNTPKPANRGIAYMDCVILYDETENTPITFTKDRSATNNIYVGIETNLISCVTSLDGVDPVLLSATKRLERIYSQTFWAIPKAFQFCMSAQALVKRGGNVDYLTIMWGPGGVGLSLLSDLIDDMYGERNHKFFDPNVFLQRRRTTTTSGAHGWWYYMYRSGETSWQSESGSGGFSQEIRDGRKACRKVAVWSRNSDV